MTTRVSWGEHRISDEGLVLAVSLGLDVERTGGPDVGPSQIP